MVVTMVVTMAGVAGSVEVATEEGVIPAVMPAAVVKGVGVTAVATEAEVDRTEAATETIGTTGRGGTKEMIGATGVERGTEIDGSRAANKLLRILRKLRCDNGLVGVEL